MLLRIRPLRRAFLTWRHRLPRWLRRWLARHWMDRAWWHTARVQDHLARGKQLHADAQQIVSDEPTETPKEADQ